MMTTSLLIGTAILSWILTMLLVRRPLPILDHPNHRSLHDRPIPRTGGLAIAISLVISVLIAIALDFFDDALVAPVVGSWCLLLTVSFIDDIRHVPAVWRILCHLVAVTLFVFTIGADAGVVITVILVLAVTWAINLFNFMDGLDGLAGGMAVLGAATLAILAWLAGDNELALLAAFPAAAVVGFLAWNLPPARIFLGDAGSVPLGFLLAALAMVGVLRGSINPVLALLPFLSFIIDASLTLLRRILQRKHFWEAHREHAYQRVVVAGMPIRRVLLLEYVLMTMAGGASLLLQYQEVENSFPHSEAVGWITLGILSAVQIVVYCMSMSFSANHANYTSNSVRPKETDKDSRGCQ
jgi:UDP-N-acetylmuramyl pentapeptide phosphotransferase/UDP-N-acetylglucosamine-1-phosphate transferase